jgi:hypothetical protein
VAGCRSQGNCRLNTVMCSLANKFLLLTDHHTDRLLSLVSSLLLSLSSFLSNEYAWLTYLRTCLLASLLCSPLRTLASFITGTYSFLFTAFCCHLLTIIRLLNNEVFFNQHEVVSLMSQQTTWRTRVPIFYYCHHLWPVWHGRPCY